VLVVDKAAGVLVQPTPQGDRGTLLDLLTRHLKLRFPAVKAPYLGLLHRIDRETSGLLLFSRRGSANRILAEQFRTHSIAREYRALVRGRVALDSGTISDRLVRPKAGARRDSVDLPGRGGKEAVTHFRVLERFPGRGAIRTIVYALYAFPPIVAGVLLYLLLRREGPLGDLGLLFTPVAILLGETLLTTPLIAGLTVSAVAELPPEVIEIVDSGGPSLRQRAIALLREARFGVTAAVLVGYGRSLAEVAAALILGGNIRGETRTLGTAILLEVNQGDFEFALALSALILAQALFMAFLLRRLQRAERAFAHRIDTSHGRPKQPTSEKTGVEG